MFEYKGSIYTTNDTTGDYTWPATWHCPTCYCNPCICSYRYGYTYTYPSYPNLSGIEKKLDKIIKLLSPEGIEELEQEKEELRRNLEEVISKYDELLKELSKL